MRTNKSFDWLQAKPIVDYFPTNQCFLFNILLYYFSNFGVWREAYLVMIQRIDTKGEIVNCFVAWSDVSSYSHWSIITTLEHSRKPFSNWLSTSVPNCLHFARQTANHFKLHVPYNVVAISYLRWNFLSCFFVYHLLCITNGLLLSIVPLWNS